jgi:hypothetical protein
MALLASACVFQEPPDWEPPKKTRPQLMDPVPSPLQFHTVNNTSFDPIRGLDTLPLFVDERSEDDGDGIRAILYVNYNGNKSTDSPAIFQAIWEKPAGTYNDVKQLSLEWRVYNQYDGCIPLTLIVTHASNVDQSFSRFPIDNEDTASITWWLNVNAPSETNVSCPVAQLTEEPSAAGAP